MYYVYLLIHPDTKIPFYVGKGKGTRASYHIRQNQRGKNTENPYKDHVIRQILSENKIPLIEYVFHTNVESDAYDLEEKLIKKYGRKRFDENGLLTNLCTDSRPPHLEYSEERKQKYRERMIGNKLAVRTQTEKEKLKRGESLKLAYASGKRVVTDKIRESTRNTHKGKTVSDETKQKQSIAAKKRFANRRGKSNEEIFGIEKAAMIREKKKTHIPPNSQPLTINGIQYTSLNDAARHLGISAYKVKKHYVNK